jgi:phosphinothricin acetyltransferase
MNINIRKVTSSDAARIRDIYNYYIANTVMTFETDILSKDKILQRIRKYTPLYPWYIAETDGNVIGYAYASEFIDRSAYRYTSEITIFIDHRYTRSGSGKALFMQLIDDMKKLGYTALMSIIAVPNVPSVRLHRSFGFKKVGHLKKVGYKLNRWIDVEYWELLLLDGKELLSKNPDKKPPNINTSLPN